MRNCASPTELNCVASYNFAGNDPKGIGVDPTISKLFGTYPQANTYLNRRWSEYRQLYLECAGAIPRPQLHGPC